MNRSATETKRNLEQTYIHRAPIIKPAKFRLQNLTLYLQLSMSTSLYDIGKYVLTKLQMLQKTGHCLFTNDTMPAKKTYQLV